MPHSSAHRAEPVAAAAARYAPERPPIAILGVPIDDVSTDEAVELIERMMLSGQPHYFATANVDFLVQAQRDPELHRILLEADLVVCDGAPVLWASRRLGRPLRERVAGADLVPRLLAVAARHRLRVFLLGASPASAAAAAARLQREFPGLAAVEHYSPPFAPLLEMDHDDIARRVRAARPDLLLVAFGCPKQEKWIAMHGRALGVPVAAGIGASIDFLSGLMRRAPLWMQRVGLEWLFRLAQEPRRLFARYARDFRVLGWRIAAQYRCLRPTAASDRSELSLLRLADNGELLCLGLIGRLDAAGLKRNPVLTAAAMADGRHCLLDLSQVAEIDSTGVGFLIDLRRIMRPTRRELVLLAPSPAVIHALRLMRLETAFALADDLAAGRELIDSRSREGSASGCVSASDDGAFVWCGEVTADNTDEVWARTETHVPAAAPGGSETAVDLSAVRFIDSSGLLLMLRAKKAAEQRGAMLRFRNPTATVRQVARLAGVERQLFG